MNVKQQLDIKVKMDDWILFEPQPIVMTKQQLAYLPTLISLLVDMPIDTVVPVGQIGRVQIYEVTPTGLVDPRLIVCPVVNLEEYYLFWKTYSSRSYTWESHRPGIYQYKEMIRGLNLERLTEPEASLLLLELHRYGNEVVRLG